MPKELQVDGTQNYEDEVPWEVRVFEKVENKVDTALEKKLEQKIEELYLKQLKARRHIGIYQALVEYYDNKISEVLEEYTKSPLNVLGSEVNNNTD